MKKLVSILFIVLLGSSSLLSQTTTGYVTVTWDIPSCEACCLGMQYGPCITVVRDFDNYVIVDDSCVVVSNTDHYEFSFTMPQCSSNWDFTVYAAVWAGCDGGPLCCHGKNPGETRTCSDLENGTGGDVHVVWE
ncbi:MAG: hypothetical protein M0Q51_08235 [Bacteroidales bacterium]|nr:hypothetical protein [Bacteroidales bacterium]